MDDREIIDLYLARSENAISETKSKYGRMIKSVAYNILNSISDSEECENDTYYAAWNKIPPERPKYLSAFLGRIARNIASDKHDYYTAGKRNKDFEVTLSELGDMLPGGITPEAELDKRAISEAISAYLKKKDYKKRTVFVRRYWYCDSVSKIALDFGFSEGKVKSMLLRMRKELKIYLEGNGIII